MDTYRELKKIGVNLNQLTKRANAGILPPGLILALEHLGAQQQLIIQILLNDDNR
ncbi:MobC family plasmid mobilization relaxosome protein [Mucilaginibacter daejeonensis]|uniref:plasmid mobilization relaxosome protein MobC n=1 Tax=Mucilaginibacter daejeonensis TaxID=398049 RepID=UPI00374D23D8|nr:MobC family plasmid mobilization relaxosome protein [Mucilaginibacter daejeonensis]